MRSGIAIADAVALALGERDALVEAEQVAARRPSSTNTATLSISRPSSSGMPVERVRDQLLEPLLVDTSHHPLHCRTPSVSGRRSMDDRRRCSTG